MCLYKHRYKLTKKHLNIPSLNVCAVHHYDAQQGQTTLVVRFKMYDAAYFASFIHR